MRSIIDIVLVIIMSFFSFIRCSSAVPLRRVSLARSHSTTLLRSQMHANEAAQNSAIYSLTQTSVNTFTLKLTDVDGSEREIHYFDSHPNLETQSTSSTSHPTHKYSPLILLGGTAQTISTFGPHLRPISANRRLIIPELRGQGRKTTLRSDHATIFQQIADLSNFIKTLNLDQGNQTVDMAGFSFGGRVCLAFAAHMPHLVRRLSITGVPLQRPMVGALVLQSWKESLGAVFTNGMMNIDEDEANRHLRTCAWSFILNGYSDAFLSKYHHRISSFVDMVVKANNCTTLYHLMEMSHTNCGEAYTVSGCASKIKEEETCNKLRIQVISCDQDRIAGTESVLDLHNMLGNERSTYECLIGGHLVPFEDPNTWRRKVLKFLDNP